ncbi:MAG: DUF938 domain-containing protein [Gammaproteobacteria bacterium]|nr:DUF938 domain-containing protein [Gammaproteobacteria bacterium]
MDYPASERNKGPILEVLRTVMTSSATVLEIAAGSGQHGAHFAAALPHLRWQATEPEPQSLAALIARQQAAGLTNFLPPLQLDAAVDAWPSAMVDFVVAINLIHISPWPTTEALFEGAARVVNERGAVIVYGPFKREGRHNSDGNIAFDADLRQRDPRWGIRDMEAVLACAAANGFGAPAIHAMPANNFLIVMNRGPAAANPG